MGGYGSGRPAIRNTTHSYLPLDVNKLLRLGAWLLAGGGNWSGRAARQSPPPNLSTPRGSLQPKLHADSQPERLFRRTISSRPGGFEAFGHAAVGRFRNVIARLPA
jgi:hypothetical protein